MKIGGETWYKIYDWLHQFHYSTIVVRKYCPGHSVPYFLNALTWIWKNHPSVLCEHLYQKHVLSFVYGMLVFSISPWKKYHIAKYFFCCIIFWFFFFNYKSCFKKLLVILILFKRKFFQFCILFLPLAVQKLIVIKILDFFFKKKKTNKQPRPWNSSSN